MFGGLAFPAITSLITLIIFTLRKMVEGLITSGFDGVLKTMPSLILFGILFKLLVTVVAKAMVYPLVEIQGTSYPSRSRIKSSNGH